MSVERGIRLRNGEMIDPTSETPTTVSLMIDEANSVDTDPGENNDVSSQPAEIMGNYESKISGLQSEFSQLKDLMMATLKKSDDEGHNINVQGLSKQHKVALEIT